MNASTSDFESNLAYSFVDAGLLTQALTHRSFSKNHNETLEFIGDAALGLIIACSVRKRFPNTCEGELSLLRASLVKGETLAEIALECGVGECLIMSEGELANGGRKRKAILADALEAIIGAVHIDGGYSCAEQVVLSWFDSRLTLLKLDDSKDAKTRLQELLQALRLALPVYTVDKTEGAQHQQLFFVSCVAKDKKSVGRGESRRKAEQDAAQNMLKILDIS